MKHRFYKEMHNMQDTKNSFHCTSQCGFTYFKTLMHHPQSPPMRKQMRSRVKSQDFFSFLLFFISCASSKLKANHREADFYLHTLQPSNCVMKPFSKPRWPQFKARSIQRKSDFLFSWWCLNAIRPKSSWFTATPLWDGRDRTIRIPQVTVQSIKEDFTALVL